MDSTHASTYITSVESQTQHRTLKHSITWGNDPSQLILLVNIILYIKLLGQSLVLYFYIHRRRSKRDCGHRCAYAIKQCRIHQIIGTLLLCICHYTTYLHHMNRTWATAYLKMFVITNMLKKNGIIKDAKRGTVKH